MLRFSDYVHMDDLCIWCKNEWCINQGIVFIEIKPQFLTLIQIQLAETVSIMN